MKYPNYNINCKAENMLRKNGEYHASSGESKYVKINRRLKKRIAENKARRNNIYGDD